MQHVIGQVKRGVTGSVALPYRDRCRRWSRARGWQVVRTGRSSCAWTTWSRDSLLSTWNKDAKSLSNCNRITFSAFSLMSSHCSLHSTTINSELSRGELKKLTKPPSLVWTGLQWWPPDVTSRGGGARGGGLYNEVQCIVGNGHMGKPSTPSNRTTDRDLWKHYLQAICWRAVTMPCKNVSACCKRDQIHCWIYLRTSLSSASSICGGGR